jgi:hypothetical protein
MRREEMGGRNGVREMGGRKRKIKRKEKEEGGFAPGGMVMDCRVAALLAMTRAGGSETAPYARGDQSFSRVISWWRREVMGPVP